MAGALFRIDIVPVLPQWRRVAPAKWTPVAPRGPAFPHRKSNEKPAGRMRFSASRPLHESTKRIGPKGMERDLDYGSLSTNLLSFRLLYLLIFNRMIYIHMYNKMLICLQTAKNIKERLKPNKLFLNFKLF